MSRRKKDKAEEFEGKDIMYYIEKEIEDIEDDELTKGRIRSIFVSLKYGSRTPHDLAEYYNLPVKVINDIAKGKIFRSITQDI